jgi:Fe2+ transport system protein FeoA
MSRTICDLSIGESARVSGFKTPETADISASMGLYTGQNIHVIHKSGAIVVGVNFRTIALGKALASRIYVNLQ